MALPVIATPTYELKVPSTDQIIKYRPFLVKEEKALLIAQYTETESTMIASLKSVIEACTFNKVKVEELALFDIEYIFTQIRAKSIGEVISLVYKCAHCDDPKAKMTINIDITTIEVKKPEGHSKTIPLFGDIGVVMKYPSIETINKFDNLDYNNIESIFEVVCECVDYIYSGEEIFSSKEQPKADMQEFINNLTQEQFKEVRKFFESMPKLQHAIEFTCPVCKERNTSVLEGLDNFFL